MNNMKDNLLLMCRLALLLLFPCSLSHAKEVQPFWYPPHTQRANIDAISVERFNAKPMELGDPKLGVWAVEQADGALAMDEQMLLKWLTVVQYYCIAEAEPALAEMVEQLMKKRPDDSDLTRGIYNAFITIATQHNKRLLSKMLRAPLLDSGQASRSAETEHRITAAGKLVLLHEPRGREFLIKHLDDYITNVQGPSTSAGHARQVAGRLYEQMMVKDLEGLKERSRYKTRVAMQERIDELIEEMQFKKTPIEQIREKITPTNGDNSYRKYLILLVYRGELADIERIEKIDLTRLNDPQEVLQAERSIKLAAFWMRCRLWAQLLDE